MGDATPDTPPARVSAAIADAGVGEDQLGVNLATVDGVAVDVVDGTATLTVTVLVPAADLRQALTQALRAAVTDVGGVTRVAVEYRPQLPAPEHPVELLPQVSTVVAVASGKGGVGKSTVAANLAVSLADAGAAVGLLDADIYGPNAPAVLGLNDGTPQTTADAQIVPREARGVRVVSMDFIVDEDDPIIWRGPMVDDVLKQLTGDTAWGDLDSLIVDMPPGTGDAQLTLVQFLPVTGAVVVTTPQAVAVADTRRGLEGFANYDVPILGVVENMSGFRCPDCDTVHDIFGDGGATDLGTEFEVPVLGRLPIDPAVGHLERDTDPTGVTVPGLGRIGLPRTAEERDGRLPPIALREDTTTRHPFRTAASRVAARVQAVTHRD
ncbi:MAG: Mrp/NBP35 family ATP-binding protein [Halobacteriaceae archaeon]